MNFKPMTLILPRFQPVVLALLLAIAPAVPVAEEDEEAPPRESLYVEMGPAFVTHVGEPSERMAYLKVDVTLRAGSEALAEELQTHMPRLRHELVQLFNNQMDLQMLSSGDGQDQLRSEALALVNAALDAQQVEASVDDVLFTSFVVQR